MRVFGQLQPAQRRNLSILFIAGLLFWASLSSLLPTLPLYVKDAGGTSQQVGLVMGAFSIGLLAPRPWLGRLADRHSRQIVLLIGMGVVGLAPLGYLLFDWIPWIALVRAFQGISIAAFATGYVTLVVDFAPEEKRGEILGYMSLVNPIGAAIGPALGGFLQEFAGYGPLFLFSALLGWVGFLCTRLVREQRRQQPGSLSVDPPFWTGSPGVHSLILVMFLVGLAFGTQTTFVALLIQETGVSLNAGLFYTAVAFASFGVRLLTGWASDRYGRGLFISMSLATYALAMGILLGANSSGAFLLAGVVVGAGFGTLIPLISALVADRSGPTERGRLFSLVMCGFDLGIGLGGPVLGTLAVGASYRSVFGYSVLLALAALVCFLVFSNGEPAASLRFALGLGPDRFDRRQPAIPQQPHDSVPLDSESSPSIVGQRR
ncbi:MAG: MFS transporter [Thermostichus sp. DG_1_6_bins_120]